MKRIFGVEFMGHDIFISFSFADQKTAEEKICLNRL